MNNKKDILETIYLHYFTWVERFPLACQKGCSACCTQSVTMTSLEGELILDFIKKKSREQWMAELLAQVTPGMSGSAITTNQYARACLAHQEVNEAALGSWNFTPCVFLAENTCSIYEVRPFGCRSFGSLVRCSSERTAEMVPIHLTVNTVFTQVIEHLSCDGGYWSNMAVILQGPANNGTRDGKMHLLPAQPVPGFLLEPHEVQVVHNLLNQLNEQTADKRFFGDLIDNFMPI